MIKIERTKLGYIVNGKNIPLVSLKDTNLILNHEEQLALKNFTDVEKRLKIQSTIK